MGASCVSFVVVGIGFYGMAVFLDALCSERGWPRTQVSFATTLYFVTSGLVGPIVGRGVDRHGPRVWMAAGAVVMALALLAIGVVSEPWHLGVVYPLLAVGFAMTGPIPASAIVNHWFEAQRARAMSIAQTGVSVGGIVMVPIVSRVVIDDGLGTATLGLALLLVCVVVPVVAFVLRDSPRPLGLEPDGAAAPAPGDPPVPASHHWTSRQAIATPTFWGLVIAFSGILFCQVATAMHQISVLRVHLTPEVAALAVSTTAAGSFVARLVVGSFADRVDYRKLGVVLILFQATSIATLSFADSGPWLFAASLFFGFTVGNLFMLQSLIVADLFGVASFGAVLGSLQLVTQTASGLGPLALGGLHAVFDGYAPGLRVLAGLAVLSALVLTRVPRPRPPGPSSDGLASPATSGSKP